MGEPAKGLVVQKVEHVERIQARQRWRCVDDDFDFMEGHVWRPERDEDFL